MFIAIGLIGGALFVLALVADEIFEGLADGLLPDSDWLSISAIATLLTAFGFGAAVLEWRLGLAAPAAAAGGLALGLTLVIASVRWSRSLRDMPTDATPTSGDLVGCSGRVVTPIAAGASGEIMARLGGQQIKLSAVGPPPGGADLGTGTEIVIVDVVSPTRVRVEPTESFWG